MCIPHLSHIRTFYLNTKVRGIIFFTPLKDVSSRTRQKKNTDMHSRDARVLLYFDPTAIKLNNKLIFSISLFRLNFSSSFRKIRRTRDRAQLICKHGYLAESHQVETADGYLLTVHRIPGHYSETSFNGKPVVLLQHGLLGSSADWVMLGPNQSLAYYLSRAGYDVWIGNSRGNTYSKAHVNVTASDSAFWEFSWHEMGLYDLPATIDHILNVTGRPRLDYVAHSQGSTIFLVMMSERPEYNAKVRRAGLMAPVANTTHTRSPIIGVFTKISTPLYYVIRFFGVNDFLPTNALLTKIGREACEARTPYQVVCSNVLFMITGYDVSLFNKTTIPILLGHSPAGSSIKQLFHFAQGHTSKKFRQFDFGSSKMNVIFYNSTEPPEYKMEHVKIPTAIYYAHNDLVADSRDDAHIIVIISRAAFQESCRVTAHTHAQDHARIRGQCVPVVSQAEPPRQTYIDREVAWVNGREHSCV
ncbi:unnamed protein product [Trichogramma brassicae]|uniref:Partial AB-hydrolase lipase domain-containing protein n=1 Tax=Trichogramma brassicae TaxID=86971 RepID=A0A6H5I7G0_9HYME|nr:unnamed protein product [Trichogramma brassicae]